MRRIFEAVYQVFFDKKWGILIKMESESLMFSGLEIPGDYFNIKGEVLWIGF
jgi:endoribonuclease, L-PSP family